MIAPLIPWMLLALAGSMAGWSSAASAGQLSDGTAVINVAAAEHAPEASHTAATETLATEASVDEEPEQVRLWPEVPAVEADKQPYLLIRSLRSVQDQIAAGSTEAHDQQRELLKDLGPLMAALPVAVWDDVRNVRAAIFLVLSGGNPAVLRIIIDRERTSTVERRLLKGALAFGEGRSIDALSMLQKLDARKIDPLLGGIVALIQGTLVAKKDPDKAITYLDEARLLSPGTLIEESALRQQILLVARKGDGQRFDLLAAQYSRRFPNSLFARGFRRQFFAGIARQNLQPASEWILRTETELKKVSPAERVGLYLAIAEEATKGGNVEIARYAAGKARELSQADSLSYQRAKLFEGAALVATPEFQEGVLLLNAIDVTKVGETDRKIRDSALAVATAVGKWPAAPAALDEAEPESVARAQAVLSKADTLLGGQSQ